MNNQVRMIPLPPWGGVVLGGSLADPREDTEVNKYFTDVHTNYKKKIIKKN